MKRILTPLLILSCILFIAYAFFTFNKERNKVTDPFTAVGADASFIIRIRQFHEVNSLIGDEPFASQAWNGFLSEVVNTVSAPENITSLSSPQWIFIQGSDPSKLCAVIPVSANVSTPIKICKLPTNATTTKFEGIDIYGVASTSYAIINGLLLISNSSSLLESCIIQALKEEQIAALSTIRQKAAKDVAVCFFGKDENNQWSALELHPSIDGVLQFSGVMLLDAQHRFSMMSKQPSLDPHLLMPIGAKAYEVWNFRDTDDWHRIADEHASDDKAQFWNAAWQNIGDTCSCNLNEALLEWKGSSYATFIVAHDSMVHSVAAYAMADSVELADLLQPISTRTTNGNFAFINSALFERYSNNLMLTEHSFGFQFKSTFYASSDEQTLEWVKSKLNAGDFWKSPEISDDAALIFDGEYSFHPYFPMGFNKILERNKGKALFRKTAEDAIIFEWIGGETQRIVTPEQSAEPTVQSIDSTLQTIEVQEIPNVRSGSEWTVINHTNNDKEIFRQNDDLSIELISSSGKSLWKAPMKEKIIGQVHQIDVYKNGKLQMAFATSKSLYVLDRNGKKVGAFPLRLKEETQAGLFVFDYDNTKVYRLMVPLINGDVINYNTDGLNTTGWKYKKGAVITSIALERIGNVETLVLTDVNGKKIKIKRNGTPL